MKANKKILSAILASTTMLSTLSSYVAVADTTDNAADANNGENGGGNTGTTPSPDASASDYQIVEPESINLPNPTKVESGNETIYVIAPTADELKKLEWSPADDKVGRNSEGYWYGMNVFSPKGLDATTYNGGKPKYQRIYSFIDANADIGKALKSAKWNDGSGIYDGEGAEDNQMYMEGWNPLTYEYIYTCAKQKKKLVYALRFDWDNDDTYEQTAAVVVDLSGINVEDFALKKPANGHTHSYTWGNVKPADSDGVCKICGAVKLKITGVSGGIADVDTMTGDNKTRYNDNLDKYSFEPVTKTDDGNYEVTCDVNVGKMKAATAGGAAGYKNVLMVVEMDKIDGFAIGNISKGGTALTDTSWVTDAPKFVENADEEDKTYVTLWMSMPNDGSKPADRIYTFKAASGDTHTKTLTVKFNDTTKYTVKLEDNFDQTDYGVALGEVDEDGWAKVTITPKDGKTITSAKYGEYGENFTSDGNGSWSGKVNARGCLSEDDIKNGKTEVVLAKSNFVVDLAAQSADSKVNLTSIIKGIDEPATMTGDELTRYKENKAFYNFSELETNADGNYIVTINSKVGKMKGETVAGTSGKNALLVLTFDKNDNIVIKKGDDVVAGGDASNGWQSTADKFVDNADTENNTYFTLWISLTDGRLNSSEEVEYTIVCGEGVAKTEKTLTVNFNDTTEYTVKLEDNFDQSEYGVVLGEVDENGCAKVTITPNGDKTITSAKYGGVNFASDGNGSWSGKVNARECLSEDDIKNGKTEAVLKKSAFNVVLAAQSTDIVATGVTAAIETSPVEEAQAARFKKNLELYKDAVTWDKDFKIATVKVPANLMEAAQGGGASGQDAANVCLVLELAKALEANEGAYAGNFSGSAIEEVDITDGYKFAGKDKSEKGRYINLWIGAGEAAFTNGNTKTVVYTDKSGNVVATVNLVKVPGIKEAPTAQENAITTVTTDAIIAQAKANLGISSNANLDELDFTVGTLPTEVGENQEVTVTVKAKTDSDCVLVNKDGTVVPDLTTTVKVTVAANTEATVTLGTPANGTFTAKTADGTTITNNAEVTVGTEITLTASPADGYNFSSWSVTDAAGNSVTVSSNKFTMPAGGVTINATFTAKPTSPSRPSGGGSYGGGGSSSSGSTSTYLDVTNKTISSNANAVKDTVRIDANSSDKSGAAVKVDKADTAVSYIRIDAPSSTRTAADWAEPIVKKASSDKLADVKKAAEEAVNAVGDNKGFALNVDILNTNKKTTVPKNNVEITVPVPGAFKGKSMYAYRITERGVVPIFATVKDNKITFAAGYAGEYIFTTEKLKNVTAYKKGNVDLDKHTNVNDATLVLKHIVALNTLKDEKLFMADVNGDGYINAKDATEILKIVVGLA